MEFSQISTSSSKAKEVSHESKEPQLPHLLKGKGGILAPLSPYQGFWCPSHVVPNITSFQTHFQPHDQDIILATIPKSGTTWVKALLFTVINRTHYTSSTTPLLTSNPHELIPSFEFKLYAKPQLPDLTTIPSPRIFSTHIPYKSLPDSLKNSTCRIVYICRNPLDLIVSYWHFASSSADNAKVPIEEMLDKYCSGEDSFGPFWDHILGYWNESLERPNKILVLKYEELKMDTIFYIKKLAKFIGFPFSFEEERRGVIEEINKLCSLRSLKDLEVNRSGKLTPNIENKDFFRKGEVGDWVNNLSPSMVECVEKVVKEKFSGSGLTFTIS